MVLLASIGICNKRKEEKEEEKIKIKIKRKEKKRKRGRKKKKKEVGGQECGAPFCHRHLCSSFLNY